MLLETQVSSVIGDPEKVDIVVWMDVFQILGIKRCQPLLAAAGVPPAMTSAPEGMMRTATFFWQSVWRGVAPKNVKITSDQAYREYIAVRRRNSSTLVEESLAMVAAAYDDASTRELYQWIKRHFTDRERGISLDAWATLFTLLMKGFVSEPSMPTSKLKLFMETIKPHLPGLLGEDDKEQAAQLTAAKLIPFSPLEERMVSLEKTHLTEDDDDLEVDLISTLELIIRRESAYQVWRSLEGWVDSSESKSLLVWGCEQARELGIPPSHVELMLTSYA